MFQNANSISLVVHHYCFRRSFSFFKALWNLICVWTIALSALIINNITYLWTCIATHRTMSNYYNPFSSTPSRAPSSSFILARPGQGIIAPPGYFVLASPNMEENFRYSCPHAGCDGFTFASAKECVQHERDWHAGPYQCAECNAKFAAAPALRRHAKASSHDVEWKCTDERCDMTGVVFESRKAY